jgi:hypothetical protein
MFEMRHKPGPEGGITAPLIVCDFCREEITDCRVGNLLWLPDEREQQYHVHKRCNRDFEARAAASRGEKWLHFLWMPLDNFLDFIGHNAGLSQAQKARQAREALMYSIRRKARTSA